MFEFQQGMFNRETGRNVTAMPPYCDLPSEAQKNGIKTADLIDILDANAEHTHYMCLIGNADINTTFVTAWRCDCFVKDGGPRFYEIAITRVLSSVDIACKADSHANFLLLLGAVLVRPATRWLPEEAFLDWFEQQVGIR